MPRPKSDREMFSFRITHGGKNAIRLLAEHRHEPMGDTVRTLLRYAMQHMPPDWRPQLPNESPR
jgi:hypothetical protein